MYENIILKCAGQNEKSLTNSTNINGTLQRSKLNTVWIKTSSNTLHNPARFLINAIAVSSETHKNGL